MRSPIPASSGLLLVFGCCSCRPSNSGGPPTAEVADAIGLGMLEDDGAAFAFAGSTEVTVNEPRDGLVRGVVRNGSSVNLLGVTLHSDFYDAEGAFVGSSHPTRYDLAAGTAGGLHPLIPVRGRDRGATHGRRP